MIHRRLGCSGRLRHFRLVAMHLAELPALASASGDLYTVLAAPLESAAPVLYVHHSLRAVLRTETRASFDIAKVWVLPTLLRCAGLRIKHRHGNTDGMYNVVGLRRMIFVVMLGEKLHLWLRCSIQLVDAVHPFCSTPVDNGTCEIDYIHSLRCM